MDNITGLVVLWKCADAGSVPAPNAHTEVLLLCPSLIMIAVFPAALALGTVLGNLLVIVAVVLNSRLARRGTSVLIVNLAIADLLV
uniref:G-protein coupled receptors family 1 profile domain-containing protein n=1 Tax=Plectus sambesii TaxID=2011161 RepID=A0A914VTV7_9BILA